MLKLIIFALMLLTTVVCTTFLFVNLIRIGIRLLKSYNCDHIKGVVKKNTVILLASIIIMVAYICITQFTVYTPKIKDSNGKEAQGGIAELRKVNLNGHNEWISIRGENKNAPVLLFLAGGPGGTQMATVRNELSELEKHFVVVNWDQFGSCKSYNFMKEKDITVNTYIEDGTVLTKYLKEQFNKEKVYLIGESWGSALGIFLINKKPEYYAGFIGTGQMVNFKKAEEIGYDKAMEIAKEKGDNKTVNKLIKLGKPPYKDAANSQTYIQYLSDYMTADHNITNRGYHTFRDMFAPEYGVLDSVNYLIALANTFNVVYPQLYNIDLRNDYNKLKVPVYFFLGRHDINAPIDIAEDYYNKLEAPKKKLIWFEHSGHSPWRNEADLFVKNTLEIFGV